MILIKLRVVKFQEWLKRVPINIILIHLIWKQFWVVSVKPYKTNFFWIQIPLHNSNASDFVIGRKENYLKKIITSCHIFYLILISDQMACRLQKELEGISEQLKKISNQVKKRSLPIFLDWYQEFQNWIQEKWECHFWKAISSVTNSPL